MPSRYCVGFEFGTESVRVLIVDIRDGRVAGQSLGSFRHGVIDKTLPDGQRLPPDYALQHPRDWLDAAGEASRMAMRQGGIAPDAIVGIGVAFTSCTMLPTTRDGTPLCLLPAFRSIPSAWPKLWKHRSAKIERDRMNQVARQRSEPWLARCGKTIGIDWFFPKVLETLNHAPDVYAAAEVWLEAGDWFVWQLVGGPLSRSTCQSGYKAMWNRHSGYPSADYFSALHPRLADVVETKMPGMMVSPGTRAGLLSGASAELLGLHTGIPVSAAIIDNHAQVPGAGVASPSTMVLVLGENACQLMNSRIERVVDGLGGPVEDGILPGYFGYQTEIGPVGKNGEGLNSEEASAFALRKTIETLRDGGVPVRRFVASGETAGKSPLLLQIYANVLNEKIALAESEYPSAQGAAILGCLAAGPEATGYEHISQAVQAIARQREDLVYRPDLKEKKRYDQMYAAWNEHAPLGPR
jgi:L-ribulokinase